MRWHYLQHAPFEGPAYLASWADSRGYTLAGTDLWTEPRFPPLSEFEGLFVLGGPMNASEENKYPWLVAEKKFIEETMKAGKIVLGVCLGAQLVSLVLGGSVEESTERNRLVSRGPDAGWQKRASILRLP